MRDRATAKQWAVSVVRQQAPEATHSAVPEAEWKAPAGAQRLVRRPAGGRTAGSNDTASRSMAPGRLVYQVTEVCSAE